MKQWWKKWLYLLLALALVLTGCTSVTQGPDAAVTSLTQAMQDGLVPEYSGEAYVVLNQNEPFFTEEQKAKTESFETYSPLDDLGRCQSAFACIGQDLMPTQERGSISQVKPTGWQSVEYPFVDGGYLYNRCHLIGFQLTGEDANEENLITGTRYLNIEGMLPFENMVADYVTETGNHVLYRVTPYFAGEELVARGVFMEGYSLEDEGEGITFCVYAYNVQPGVVIDYATGQSHSEGESTPAPIATKETTDAPDEQTTSAPTEPSASDSNDDESTDPQSDEVYTYILNINTMKFHWPQCSSVSRMSAENRQEYTATRQSLLNQGYEPCGQCHP